MHKICRHCICLVVAFFIGLTTTASVGAATNSASDISPLDDVAVMANRAVSTNSSDSKPYHLKLAWDKLTPFSEDMLTVIGASQMRLFSTTNNSQIVSNLYTTNSYTFVITAVNGDSGTNNTLVWRPSFTNNVFVWLEKTSDPVTNGGWLLQPITNKVVLVNPSGQTYYRPAIAQTNNLWWIRSFEQLD